MFEQESYSFTVSETAPANHLIGTITAKDLDSGRYGTHGIRYSLTGAGSELFRVNDNGAITVAECHSTTTSSRNMNNLHRKKRDTTVENAKKVNLTIVGETGVIDVDDDTNMSTTELYYPYARVEEVTFRPFFSVNDDYMVMGDDSDEETTTEHETVVVIDENNDSHHPHYHHTNHHYHTNELNGIDASHGQLADPIKHATVVKAPENSTQIPTDGPGHAPCLDYETQSVYFLTYKVRNFCYLLNLFHFFSK